MARAVVIRLTARAALLSVLQDPHSWIKETTNLGLIALIRGIGCNFYDRATLNLIGAENAELDPKNGLNFRITVGSHL
jgi:hypothetical protein